MAPDSIQQGAATVCVMDASGHVGTSLVQRLLQRGYNVHAAVQTHCNNQILEGFGNENNRLRIFNTDLFDFQSIIKALNGCSGLFYTFEPPQDLTIYDEGMADVEVKAAQNVLEACAQTETIDKIVYTSSATSIIWRDDRKSPSFLEFDEKHWSDINLCRKFKLWHALSKTLAEQSAWSLAKDRDQNMVCVNAGLHMSPHLSITNPYLKGAAEMYEYGVFVTVDTEFLVDAHVCVFEDVSSYGRYLCFNHVINRPEDAANLAQMLTPGSPQPPPPRREQDMSLIQQRISNKKLNKLMVEFKNRLNQE